MDARLTSLFPGGNEMLLLFGFNGSDDAQQRKPSNPQRMWAMNQLHPYSLSQQCTNMRLLHVPPRLGSARVLILLFWQDQDMRYKKDQEVVVAIVFMN